jgi:RNA polymerase sigma-70 factor, ECF subfamily
LTANTATLSDEELVHGAQAGKQEAFTCLYERYLPIVFSRVRFKVPEADVEDITQEIFIDVIKSLANFRGNSKFSTWLWTLTNHKIADYYRINKSKFMQQGHSEETTQQPSSTHSSAPTSSADDLICIQRSMRKLTKPYQEILLLRFVEQIPFNEIALRNGQSLEATKSLFRRAVAALRKEMDEDNA